MEPEKFVAYEVNVRGRVQGVGFRWSVEDIARRHGVAGWVRNQPDGSVDLWVQGPAAAVQEFLAEVGDMPYPVKVSSLLKNAVQPAAGMEEFHITHY